MSSIGLIRGFCGDGLGETTRGVAMGVAVLSGRVPGDAGASEGAPFPDTGGADFKGLTGAGALDGFFVGAGERVDWSLSSEPFARTTSKVAGLVIPEASHGRSTICESSNFLSSSSFTADNE